jgi:hypothetical protein
MATTEQVLGWKTRAQVNAQLQDWGYDTHEISIHGLSFEGYQRFIFGPDGKRAFNPADGDVFKVFTPWKDPAHGEFVMTQLIDIQYAD